MATQDKTIALAFTLVLVIAVVAFLWIRFGNPPPPTFEGPWKRTPAPVWTPGPTSS